ncbi:MAG TPA: FN3 domain-containing metallophosphoesterase family protein [Bryobacteraceae bacterium]|nr:FN3 domain-containing metallophosphoesterase family protein [Bryobacteraceae bacterium]
MTAQATLALFLLSPLAASAADAFAFSSGPYVQSPLEGSATIVWLTSRNATGWVEYGKVGTAPRRAVASRDGLIDAGGLVHKVPLTGLEPGAEYQYRVYAKEIIEYLPYRPRFGDVISSPPATFRTAKPGPAVNFLFFTDVHGRTGMFTELLKANAGRPYDFAVLGGDMLDHLDSHEQLRDLLGPVGDAFAGHIPFFWVRGNHETRGRYARELPRYIASPNGHYYYAFDWGPARLVVLDTGEDKEDGNREYSGLADFDAYRREQAAWLAREIRGEQWRKAKFRIVLAHMPFPAVPGKEWHGQLDCYRVFGPLLNEGGADLMLSGHQHQHAVIPPEPGQHGYAIVRGGAWNPEGRTVIRVEVEADQLRAVILRPDGSEAGRWEARSRVR